MGLDQLYRWFWVNKNFLKIPGIQQQQCKEKDKFNFEELLLLWNQTCHGVYEFSSSTSKKEVKKDEKIYYWFMEYFETQNMILLLLIFSWDISRKLS